MLLKDCIFCDGDHISWHSSLDGSKSSIIQHMLITKDTQLHAMDTPHGVVQFLQIVGLTSDELQAAQRWNGIGILNIMKKFPLYVLTYFFIYGIRFIFYLLFI